MSGSSPSLRELIDIDELQSIQDSFARAAGISSVILSPEGEPLTKFTNPTGFCTLIQSTEKGKERCFRSFMEMGKIALGSEKSEIFYCFVDGGHFVAPIMIDGEHKGTMFAGQFTPEKFSSEQLQNLEEIAPEIDLDPGTLVKEAEKMRVVGEDVIRNYSSLLFKVVEVIARRGVQAAELERRVQERTDELAEANKGLAQEVAERKLAEEALQKERDRAQHYLDIAGVMFLVIGADRKVILINRKGCEILGYDEEDEITGKDWFDNFVPKRSRDEVARVFKSLIAGDIEPVEYYENPVLTKHGEERTVAWNNTILRDEQGRIYATIASGEDITEQIRADWGLRESEEKFRILAENSIDCIWLLDSKLRFTYLSPSLERIMGFKPEQWVGTRMSSHFKKKEFLKVGILSAKAIKNYKIFTHVTFETKMLNSKNDEVDVEISSKALLDSRGKLIGLQGTTKDITERKAAEDAIHESEEKYRTIYDSSKDAIMTLTPEGGFLSGNPAAVKIFGCKSDKDFISRTPHELSPPYQPDGALSSEKAEQMMAIAMEKGSHLFEWTHKQIDGKEFPATVLLTRMELQGRRVLQTTVRDITEQKAAEDAIRASEEKLRMITTSANDAILMMDPEGNVSYWNKAAEQMFGYTEEEVIGKDLHALLMPERFHAGFSKGFEGFKETGQGAALGKTLELAAFGKDGKEFPVEISLSAVKLKGRWNAIGLIRDTTERKAAEEELKKRADELEKFNRLAVGRELRMIELKKEINTLLEESGKESGYKIVGES